jgi:hypothetical protein
MMRSFGARHTATALRALLRQRTRWSQGNL